MAKLRDRYINGFECNHKEELELMKELEYQSEYDELKESVQRYGIVY